MGQVKGIAEEGHFHNHGGQQEGQDPRTPEPLVLILHRKDGAVERTHVEAVENFCHGQGQERHGGTQLCSGIGTGGDSVGMVQICQHICADEVGNQCDDGYQNALIPYSQAQTAGKDTFLGISGLPLHDVRFGLFHPQSQSRETVGNQVDPQQLYRLENGEAQQGGYENGQDFGQVGCQQELDGLADVVVNPAAFPYGTDDGGKVVVGQNHVGHVFGNVGTGDPHTHADVRILDGGCVVDTVTGHCGNHALLPPCIDNTGLVFGLYSGIYGILFYSGIKFFIRDLVQFRTGDGGGSIGQDAQLHGNGNGGILVVPGDHDGTHTGAAAFFDGRLYFRTYGVDHPGKTDEAQTAFDVGRFIGSGFRRQHLLGSSQHTERLVRHNLVGLQNGLLMGVCDGNDLAVLQHMGTVFQHFVRCALGKLDQLAVGGLVDGGHHLPHGIEGYFPDSGQVVLLAVLIQSQLSGIIDQCAFGGFPDGFAFFQLCVGAEGHGGGQQGFVAAPVFHHGHLVLGQGTGLVGADDLGASQGFHSGHLPDDGGSVGHVGHADGQNDGHNGGKAFGDGSNGQGYGYHEGVKHGVYRQTVTGYQRTDQVDGKNDNADTDNQPCQDLGQLGQLLLQGGLAVFRLGQRIGDLPHFGVHTGSGHHSGTASVHHGGAHEDHVLPVTQRNIPVFPGSQGVVPLGNRHGFPGQGGFFDLHAGAGQDPCIGRNGIPGFQNDNIAHHQVFAADGLLVSVTDDL